MRDSIPATIMDPVDDGSLRALARTDAAITAEVANQLFMECVDAPDIVAVYEATLDAAITGNAQDRKLYLDRVLGRNSLDINVKTLNITDMIQMAIDAGAE